MSPFVKIKPLIAARFSLGGICLGSDMTCQLFPESSDRKTSFFATARILERSIAAIVKCRDRREEHVVVDQPEPSLAGMRLLACYPPCIP